MAHQRISLGSRVDHFEMEAVFLLVNTPE